MQKVAEFGFTLVVVGVIIYATWTPIIVPGLSNAWQILLGG